MGFSRGLFVVPIEGPQDRDRGTFGPFPSYMPDTPRETSPQERIKAIKAAEAAKPKPLKVQKVCSSGEAFSVLATIF